MDTIIVTGCLCILAVCLIFIGAAVIIGRDKP